jgi:holo-[acyl-carrier protein] synthase
MNSSFFGSAGIDATSASAAHRTEPTIPEACAPTAASRPETPPACIAGIGLDLLRIDRVEKAVQRHGERFAEKILGPEELQKYRARSARDPRRGIRFLATRFAAKEAFSKAIGLGMRMPMTWRRVQTLNAPGGRPILVIAPVLLPWYEARFGAAHVSLTDEIDMAAAYVIVERKV